MTRPRTRFAMASPSKDMAPSEVGDWIAALADEFSHAGIEPGEPVAITASYSAGDAVSILAARAAGACPVPMSHRLPTRQRVKRAVGLGARLLLDPEPSQGPDAGLAVVAPPTSPGGAWNLPRLSGTSKQVQADLGLYTSGTTGQPKLVLHDWSRITEQASLVRSGLGLSRQNRWLLSLPFTHAAGLGILLRVVNEAATLLVTDGASGQNVETLAGELGATHASLVPAQMQRWLETPVTGRPIPSLQRVIVGGSTVDPALIIEARRRGIPACTTYGLTETFGMVTLSKPDDPPQTAGTPLAGVRLRLMDDHGRQKEANESGTLWVQTPTRMLGYHPLDRRSRAEDWLPTTDVARVDEAGRLIHVADASHRIHTGGEVVDPARVEAVLMRHPLVHDAVVRGDHDPAWGQRVVADVVLSAPVDPAELVYWCKTNLASHEVPRAVRVVERVRSGPDEKASRRRLDRVDESDVGVRDPV